MERALRALLRRVAIESTAPLSLSSALNDVVSRRSITKSIPPNYRKALENTLSDPPLRKRDSKQAFTNFPKEYRTTRFQSVLPWHGVGVFRNHTVLTCQIDSPKCMPPLCPIKLGTHFDSSISGLSLPAKQK